MRRDGMGERLERLRRERMLTQGRLAEEAGVSPTTVSGIESGRIVRPHFGTVRKLAGALGVDPETLVARRAGGAGVPEAPGGASAGPLSLAWAREAPEEEFDREVEEASAAQLDALARDLEQERGRLQRLYAESPPGEERRFIKRRIRAVSAHSGSVSAQVHSNEVNAGAARELPEKGGA